MRQISFAQSDPIMIKMRSEDTATRKANKTCMLPKYQAPTWIKTSDCSRFKIEGNSNDSPLLQDRGLTPTISASEFWTLINSKGLVQPRNPTDFTTTNRPCKKQLSVLQSRFNKNCYQQILYLFPRTTIDWNNLEIVEF